MKKLLLAMFLIVAAIPAFADTSNLVIGSTSGFSTQTVSIPITANITVGTIAAQFDVQYDPALLTFTGITVGSSNTGWAVVSNVKTPGKLRVGMYNTAQIIGNSLQLALLNFTVITPASGATLLALPNLVLSNAYFNEYSVVNLVNGSFTLKLLGDVDNNGKVEAADATLVAQYALELTTLTADQLQVADVSGNGTVSFYDASLIAQYAKGIITKFH